VRVHRSAVSALSLIVALAVMFNLAACDPGGAPPTTAPTTLPTATTWPAGQLDCGIQYMSWGWPTTTVAMPGTFDCILGAFTTGTSARFIQREQTDGSGGHIKITTYGVVGTRSVRVTVDSSGALPPAGISITICTQLSYSFPRLTIGDCTA